MDTGGWAGVLDVCPDLYLEIWEIGRVHRGPNQVDSHGQTLPKDVQDLAEQGGWRHQLVWSGRNDPSGSLEFEGG